MSGVLTSALWRGSASNAFPSLSFVRGVARIHHGCDYSRLQARAIAESVGFRVFFYYVSVFGNWYLPPENTEYFSFTA